MLELHFTQTLGNHTLTLDETLPATGITAIFGVSGAGKTGYTCRTLSRQQIILPMNQEQDEDAEKTSKTRTAGSGRQHGKM